MKTISNALHADLARLLESVAGLPSDGTVKRSEMKRKAALLKRKLLKNGSQTHRPRQEQRQHDGVVERLESP